MTITCDLITRFLDAFNRHNLEEGMSFFAEDCVFLTHSGNEKHGSKIEGKQQVHTAFAAALEAMPDAHWEMIDCWIHDDVAIVHWLFTGTDAEGEHTEVYGVDILTFFEMKIMKKNAFRKDRVSKK